MKTRFTLASLGFALLLFSPVFGVEFLDTKSVFSGEAEVCLTDGSSIYIFHPKGEFTLEPLGISGRTIKGHWTYNADGLHITGIWEWVNGTSVPSDRRNMDIHIGYLGSKTTDYTSALTNKKHKIQEAYFVIDRLEKQQ
jgi:hypothetical protein